MLTLATLAHAGLLRLNNDMKFSYIALCLDLFRLCISKDESSFLSFFLLWFIFSCTTAMNSTFSLWTSIRFLHLLSLTCQHLINRGEKKHPSSFYITTNTHEETGRLFWLALSIYTPHRTGGMNLNVNLPIVWASSCCQFKVSIYIFSSSAGNAPLICGSYSALEPLSEEVLFCWYSIFLTIFSSSYLPLKGWATHHATKSMF